MAVLSCQQILDRTRKGEIGFSPELDQFQMQSHAVDLRLGFTFILPKSWRMTVSGREAVNVNPLKDGYGSECFDVIELEQGQYFELLPNEYVSVSSLETVKIPSDLMGVLYPRSSVNRRGLSVDLTGIVDSGYEGQLMIPVKNNTSSQVIRLYPGERFCQIVFETLTDDTVSRKSRYHGRDITEGLAKENNSEVKYILSGKIRELKADHPVSK